MDPMGTEWSIDGFEMIPFLQKKHCRPIEPLKISALHWDDAEKISYSDDHVLVITGYNWVYTFYKWGYKYL